ncbi:uncharacterized protein LOC121237698 [Juglans microcarpa x Juglans regia]|uniref:uncharacterized protein LOC121237698 n=1 Tax=Juglans microcarpa x Juglans regia TaxID=2249226 RepID=UPI001B7E2FE8|nr:uncharacterized protein LOC121237698 [Juglans microcarpa x Juglans regia]
MEVYVDDLLVKSKEAGQHLADLREAFSVLQQHRMKLNPLKCAFRVEMDFGAEFTNFSKEVLNTPQGKPWQVYVDYSSYWAGRGVEVHIVTKQGEEHDYVVKLAFKTTNNEAEYEVLLAGMTVARLLGDEDIEVRADSQVVVSQVLGEFATKGERLKKYLQLIYKKRDCFHYFSIQQEELLLPKHTVVRTINAPSIGAEVSVTTQAPPEWATDIQKFLLERQLPSDPEEARKVRNRVAWFTMLEGVLYNRGFSEPLLKCHSSNEPQYVLVEIHEGIFGSHLGVRALAARVTRARYYWPHVLKDVEDFVKKCPKCQEHKLIPHCPAEELTSVIGPWPFIQWGLGLIGSFPAARGGAKFFHYRSRLFHKEWCAELEIKVKYSSLGHPQANGQTEATNKTLLSTLKKKIRAHKRAWAEELPSVRTLTGETPFSLTYGSQAVIPVEVRLPTFCVQHFNPDTNNERLDENLDALEEREKRKRSGR